MNLLKNTKEYILKEIEENLDYCITQIRKVNTEEQIFNLSPKDIYLHFLKIEMEKLEDKEDEEDKEIKPIGFTK